MIHVPKPEFMEIAIGEARKNLGISAGGPFGAAIVLDNRIVAAARNTVLRNDATAHAEINAIRQACRKLGTHDLSGSVMYSTTEPCPMCFSAVHWARIGTIIHGTTISDAKAVGFNELEISNERLKALGRSGIRIVGNFLRDECLALFRQWEALPGKRLY
jgi:guanine deaminase